MLNRTWFLFKVRSFNHNVLEQDIQGALNVALQDEHPRCRACERRHSPVFFYFLTF